MMSYAGVDLPIVSNALAAWIEQNINPNEAYEFDSFFDANSMTCLPVPDKYTPPAVQCGVLYWPTHATRWSVFHTVLSGEQLAALRTSLASGESEESDKAGYPSALLKLDDDRHPAVEAQMYILPPRPLMGWFKQKDVQEPEIPGPPIAQDQPGDLGYHELNDMWLVTLVDERYFWWFRQGDPLAGTWVRLVDSLFNALRITSPVPADIGEGYPSPKGRWRIKRRPLPVMLDAVAYSIGRRVIRKLDGTVELQTWEQAREASKNFLLEQYAEAQDGVVPELSDRSFGRIAGGMLEQDDLRRRVPQYLDIIYAKDGSKIEQVALKTLSIPEYENFIGMSNEVASIRIDDVGTNEVWDKEKVAKDWYGWYLANVDTTMAGLVKWDACAWQDYVRWMHRTNSQLMTRVGRPPWPLGVARGLCDDVEPEDEYGYGYTGNVECVQVLRDVCIDACCTDGSVNITITKFYECVQKCPDEVECGPIVQEVCENPDCDEEA